MKESVLSGLRRTASKRMKRLQAKAAQTADELLEKSYVGTAEQTLRGAETMTNILHEKDRTIAKAKRTIAKKPNTKKRSAKKPSAATKSKRNISKRSTKKVVRRKRGSR